MAHYLFNVATGDAADAREHASRCMGRGMWDVDAGERHRGALAVGDLVLIYLGAPARELVGRAELASAAHEGSAEVSLTRVEEWDPPVPMGEVLPRLGPEAKADFDTGVVLITAHEYETAVAVAAERTTAAG